MLELNKNKCYCSDYNPKCEYCKEKDNLTNHSPQSKGDDASVHSTTDEIVGVKASIPDSASCKPETLEDTFIQTLKSEWRKKVMKMGILSGQVAVFELEGLIDKLIGDKKC